MIAIGMVLLWSGYAVGSWGYVLVRGWNIPFGAWISPVNTYQWPKAGDPPIIPAGQLLPGTPVLTPQEAKAAGATVGQAVQNPPAAVKTG